jgi:hypothetical protein
MSSPQPTPQSNTLDTLKTNTEITNDLIHRGFTMNFSVEAGKLLATDEQNEIHRFAPSDVTILEHFRTEGESDPADMSVIYGLQTTTGQKGVLIDAFGTYANPEIGEFLEGVKKDDNSDVDEDNAHQSH